jgi:hypothetical protein
MTNTYFPNASPYLKAYELLECVLIADRKAFTATFHVGELPQIKDDEYYVVEVRRVPLPPLEMKLDEALPLPAYMPEVT